MAFRDVRRESSRIGCVRRGGHVPEGRYTAYPEKVSPAPAARARRMAEAVTEMEQKAVSGPATQPVQGGKIVRKPSESFESDPCAGPQARFMSNCK